MEVRANTRLVNPAGLHARPCHSIVSLVRTYESALAISAGGREVNGRSILELMTLGAPCDTVLSLRATGEDAAVLIAALVSLIESGFGECS